MKVMGKEWFVKRMPVFAMISLQIMYASMSLATKTALEKGFSPIIFLVYRQATASILLTSVSIIAIRRKLTEVLAMGKKGFFLLFISALIGVTMHQICYFKGLQLASATIASAVSNLIPAMTFLMAAAVGLEKVKLGSIRSMAKVLGTIICVCGAIVMTLLKGQKLVNTEFKRVILTSFLQAAGEKWLLGCFFLIASFSCWSAWLIMQVPICRYHVDPLSLSTWMCVLSTFQSAILALFIEPDWRVWRTDSGLALLFCFYAGLCSAVSYIVQSWCISIKGPLFSAMFCPLSTVITTISASLLLHEELYIGSFAGAAVIVAGLYIVLWGKAEDMNGGKQKSRADDNDIKITVSSENPHRISEYNLDEPLISSFNEQC